VNGRQQPRPGIPVAADDRARAVIHCSSRPSVRFNEAVLGREELVEALQWHTGDIPDVVHSTAVRPRAYKSWPAAASTRSCAASLPMSPPASVKNSGSPRYLAGCERLPASGER
jgi:hypothetical protein